MILVDAGPLYAILNKGDDHHGACVTALKDIKEPLVTTWAAFTEALYFLGADFGWHGQRQLWSQYWDKAFEVAEPTVPLMRRMCDLMDRYQDTPMDLADASLVALAEDQDCERIFTVDRSGFSIYRLNGNRPFRIVP